MCEMLKINKLKQPLILTKSKVVLLLNKKNNKKKPPAVLPMEKEYLLNKSKMKNKKVVVGMN
ncbi:hypothetical protein IV439_01010 [Enterococcus faecalis]|nr:hypothetical protein [Enterococcus faecalis]